MNFDLKTVDDAAIIKDALMKQWNIAEKTPNVFRYKLNVEKQAILNGEHHFFVQV